MDFRKVLARCLLALVQIGDGVQTKAIDTESHPKIQNLQIAS